MTYTSDQQQVKSWENIRKILEKRTKAMNSGKWQINRAGLVDFWYYDEETFEFSEGRMLLRGSNGSGKSVTMQSFIPLLLEGKWRIIFWKKMMTGMREPDIFIWNLSVWEVKNI